MSLLGRPIKVINPNVFPKTAKCRGSGDSPIVPSKKPHFLRGGSFGSATAPSGVVGKNWIVRIGEIPSKCEVLCYR